MPTAAATSMRGRENTDCMAEAISGIDGPRLERLGGPPNVYQIGPRADLDNSAAAAAAPSIVLRMAAKTPGQPEKNTPWRTHNRSFCDGRHGDFVMAVTAGKRFAWHRPGMDLGPLGQSTA